MPTKKSTKKSTPKAEVPKPRPVYFAERPGYKADVRVDLLKVEWDPAWGIKPYLQAEWFRVYKDGEPQNYAIRHNYQMEVHTRVRWNSIEIKKTKVDYWVVYTIGEGDRPVFHHSRIEALRALPKGLTRMRE